MESCSHFSSEGMPPRDGRAAETVDKVRGAAVVVSERFLKGVPAGEPGGDELPERAVGGERVVPKLLHRDRAGPVAQHQPPGDMQLTAP